MKVGFFSRFCVTLVLDRNRSRSLSLPFSMNVNSVHLRCDTTKCEAYYRHTYGTETLQSPLGSKPVVQKENGDSRMHDLKKYTFIHIRYTDVQLNTRPSRNRAAKEKGCVTAELSEGLKHTCHLEFSGVTARTEPVQTNIGFVSKSYLKVGCVNLPANGPAKASLLFRPQPPSTEGVSTRLISGGSPEVLHAMWA